MFGMGQCLKLARAVRGPFAEGIILHCLLKNACEELRLRQKFFGRQAGLFPGVLDRGKIDVRGQVLFAGVGQQIAGGTMTEIRAQRAIRPRR